MSDPNINVESGNRIVGEVSFPSPSKPQDLGVSRTADGFKMTFPTKITFAGSTRWFPERVFPAVGNLRCLIFAAEDVLELGVARDHEFYRATKEGHSTTGALVWRGSMERLRTSKERATAAHPSFDSTSARNRAL